ncbi:winged helix-turn-helix domain-containing protein [Chloroflexus sp.]|uniref:winged helix-turn-helix domain-containing protein n=1 Tax=Chloroflexus sp. TaxID=1904827 RepID=UPI0026317609|nr:helix-turn-helix domain-containing protein [uncultured Chloroflexus sp.]
MGSGVALILDRNGSTRAALLNCLCKWHWPVLVTSKKASILCHLADQRVSLCIINTKLFSNPYHDLQTFLNALLPHQILILAGDLSLSPEEAANIQSTQLYQLPYPVPEMALQTIISSHFAGCGETTKSYTPASSAQGHRFEIDTQRRRLLLRDREVRLSRDELKLLQYLYEAKGRVCRYNELARLLFPSTYTDDEARHLLRGRMYYLQSKIEPNPKNPQYLICVRGAGYQLLTKGKSEYYASWLATSIYWTFQQRRRARRNWSYFRPRGRR